MDVECGAHPKQGFERRISDFAFDKTDHGAGEAGPFGQLSHGKTAVLTSFPQQLRDLGANCIPQLGIGHAKWITDFPFDKGRNYSNGLNVCLPEFLVQSLTRAFVRGDTTVPASWNWSRGTSR